MDFGRRLYDGPSDQALKFQDEGVYEQQKDIAEIMLNPTTDDERLFSLSARDWLSKAFMASGVGSGLPIRPSSTYSALNSPLIYQGAKYDPYDKSAYPEVVGLPYKIGRKSDYSCEGGKGEVKTLPQRLKAAFDDGSLNLPEQCLWYMEMKGGCHDPHFTLKSTISGKTLTHPNMAGMEAMFGQTPGADDVNGVGAAHRHTGLVLSRDKFTPLTFASGLASDSISRWKGWPTCAGDQNIGSSQRKTCIAEHTCLQCGTGYADCNTMCADKSVPLGTTGNPLMMPFFNVSHVPWGGADVCHRAPVVGLDASVTTSFNGAGTVVMQLSVKQNRKDVVAPQLFNVTLTYERPGIATPVTRSHLLAYESGSSVALEQIKGVPCGGPISVTAAACTVQDSAADSHVDCNFPATLKTLSNPCPAAEAPEADVPASAAQDSAAAPVVPATPAVPAASEPAAPATTSSPPQPTPAKQEPLDEAASPVARAARFIPRSENRVLEAIIGVSLVLLLGSCCYLLVRRLFRPALRSDRLIEEGEESAGQVRYEKRQVGSSPV